MSDALGKLTAEYIGAVEAYLVKRDEAALSVAYELGRRAMVDGLGVLDIAALHRSALQKLVIGAPASAQRDLAEAAEDFYAELLSPFEMTLRGYRAANEDLQRLNESLRQQKDAVEIANRELESFSYSVSHDLRAPLRSIDGFSQALLEDYAPALDDAGKRYLRHVREATQHMAQLIDDLLGLARVTRTEVNRADVDLGALARRIAEQLRAGAPERKVRFLIDEPLRAHCDARLLGVVLQNLLGNAWKFTAKREEAEIAFASEQRDGVATYFVRDNGAGFDMRYASRLFGAFQRLHSAKEFDGTGIGLATVQRVVHRHGGRVWAEGEVGVGATFYFTLSGGRR